MPKGGEGLRFNYVSFRDDNIRVDHKWTDGQQRYSVTRNPDARRDGVDAVRYSVVRDGDTLAKLNGGRTIRAYRAMQLVNGRLYPPMAAKVDGKWQEPAEIGEWLQADERPDLVDGRGHFKLNKGNGSTIRARYNPYWHTSLSMLNDQFSSAKNRPNLVTVEVEVPEAELTSGYRAKGAKDAVGKMKWHSGPVSSRLAKLGSPREVILSRWCRVVRIVPDAEVADAVARQLDGTGIAVPENTVTPSLYAELRKRGVATVTQGGEFGPGADIRYSVVRGEVVNNRIAPAYANALTFKSASEQDAKASVKAWRNERRVFTNEMNGRRAEIKSDWSKIFSTPAKKKSASYEAHYAAANHLDTLFEHGVKMWEEAPRNGSNDIRAYAKYGCPFELNGDVYLAKITVKEYSSSAATDGLYSVEAISVEKIGAEGINAGITSIEGHELDLGATVALSKMLTPTPDIVAQSAPEAQAPTPDAFVRDAVMGMLAARDRRALMAAKGFTAAEEARRRDDSERRMAERRDGEDADGGDYI